MNEIKEIMSETKNDFKEFFEMPKGKKEKSEFIKTLLGGIALMIVCYILYMMIYFLAPAGYWRKANQIHGWFVENVQNGVDECKKTYVPKEKLIELKELCEDLLHTKDKQKAQELLPATSGFFFGSTDTNDKYYWECYW